MYPVLSPELMQSGLQLVVLAATFLAALLSLLVTARA